MENKGTHQVEGRPGMRRTHGEEVGTQPAWQCHPSSPGPASLCQLGGGRLTGRNWCPACPPRAPGSEQAVREQRGARGKDAVRSELGKGVLVPRARHLGPADSLGLLVQLSMAHLPDPQATPSSRCGHICRSFFFFRATPVANGGSQARGQIRATAAGLHHSSRQCWIHNPLSGARDRTCILMDTSWVHYC